MLLSAKWRDMMGSQRYRITRLNTIILVHRINCSLFINWWDMADDYITPTWRTFLLGSSFDHQRYMWEVSVLCVTRVTLAAACLDARPFTFINVSKFPYGTPSCHKTPTTQYHMVAAGILLLRYVITLWYEIIINQFTLVKSLPENQK